MSSQPPKDFLALSHGHEWVNFYESFDKLVQDHLSRSSELLRKAMALPEVADREVAELRSDLEGRLTTERERNAASLQALKTDIGNTQQQASSIVRLVAAMIGDLDRLSSNVDQALALASPELADPVAASESVATIEVPTRGGTAELNADATSQGDADFPEAAWSELTAAVDAEQTGDSDAEAVSAEDSDAEIDLHKLAELEEQSTTSEEPESASETVGETVESNGADSEQNGSSRPHWLSMARSNN